MSDDVFVIVLNWNQWPDTQECLASLRQCDADHLRVVVVDNGSVDGSGERVIETFPDVELLPQSRNLGFAEGNNVGIRHALARGAGRIMLLNNDTILEPGFLGPLDEALDRRPHVGIVGPKIRYHPDVDTLWGVGGLIDWVEGRQFHIGAGERDEGQHDVDRAVDYVSACCLLARREVFERAGLLDPRYFIYFEETDWNLRAARLGYERRSAPASLIYHKVSRAMGTGSPISDYYYARNRLLFFATHAPARRRLPLIGLYTARSLRYAGALEAHGRRDNARAVARGVADFYLRRFGQCRMRFRNGPSAAA